MPESSRRPDSHRRAVSFTIARLMSRKVSAEIVTPILRRIFCKPFLVKPSPSIVLVESTEKTSKTVSEAVHLMSALLVNADPSPAMIHLLLSPIIVPLYSLVIFLDDRRGAVLNEPALRELSRGLLMTWGRVAGSQDVIKGWWNIIQGVGGWGIDEGENMDEVPKEWVLRAGSPTIATR